MDTKKYTKNYFEVINERFSCRSFTAEKLSTEQIKIILESAQLAPTACNFQPQIIYVVENPVLLDKLKEATRFTFDAKTIFVVCHDKSKSWHRRSDEKDHGDIDATIVATHMMLEATNLGVDNIWIEAFDENILREELNIPQQLTPVCLLPLGYKTDDCPINPMHNMRKSISEIVEYR